MAQVAQPAPSTTNSGSQSNILLQCRQACACGGTCPKCQAEESIQPKLKVGARNDKYEQEADRVADQVMRMPESQVQRQVEAEEEEELIRTKSLSDSVSPVIQRQVEEEEEEEEKEELLQAKGKANTGASMSPSVSKDIQSIRGGGHPLSKTELAFFEPRFGRDFSQVRVHTDEKAARTAQAINAQAFTAGNDVVFGQGQYVPGNSSSNHLLAHELTHVVQQTGSRSTPAIQRKVDSAKCTASRIHPKKCDMPDKDNFLAMYYIMQTMQALRASKYSARVKKALKCYFNIHGRQYNKKLIANLQLIQKWLSIYKTLFYYEKGYPVGCKTTTEGKPLAYARPATWSKGRIIAFGRIGLCPLYFHVGQPRRVRTLIHEQAHVVGFVPRSGAKELRVGSKVRKQLPATKLLKSADGYAHFVMAVATGKFTGC